ncbi:hypothetical protein EVAR_89483_1 [Eumeta japonica]|uniref:Uncharacterized protein n=1 Tax=Eumeta variegata TaxID=151549 RepID=A0A4C1XH45_EUMVA|nr:hypothetical protein EVAR_89483_1 [Eumeta japonica]
MKNSISELARARNDDWGQAIVERLEQVTDLVAADAQYHNSCMKKLYQTRSTEERKKRGPYACEIDTAMQYIYSYLEENSEECQFSLDELMTKIEGDYRPHIKIVKAQLLKKYGDDILIVVTANEAPVVWGHSMTHDRQRLSLQELPVVGPTLHALPYRTRRDVHCHKGGTS